VSAFRPPTPSLVVPRDRAARRRRTLGQSPPVLSGRRRRLTLGLLALEFATALLAGCGGGGDEETTAARPPLVPPAKTEAEWANRLANRFFISIEQDVRIINLLSRPDLLLNLYNGNPDTIAVVKQRMSDLQLCSYKLARVGPPPPSQHPLLRVHTNLQRSCASYEKMAGYVLEAAALLSSDDPAKQKRGQQIFARATAPSRLAAAHYGKAIRLIARDRVLSELVLLGPSTG